MSYICIVNQKSALDQHSTSANESVEEAWRISSAHRVNCVVLRENYEALRENSTIVSGSLWSDI